MRMALEQAQRAAELQEVPVGAIVVYRGQMVGVGYNQPILRSDPTAHAEVMALRDAASYMGNYRLSECDLYVTIEPCTMCMGAMLHARIRHLCFGAREPRAGAALSHFGLHQRTEFNHTIEVTEGALAEECSDIIKRFFRERRGGSE